MKPNAAIESTAALLRIQAAAAYFKQHGVLPAWAS
jgi:hypothetical protein